MRSSPSKNINMEDELGMREVWVESCVPKTIGFYTGLVLYIVTDLSHPQDLKQWFPKLQDLRHPVGRSVCRETTSWLGYFLGWQWWEMILLFEDHWISAFITDIWEDDESKSRQVFLGVSGNHQCESGICCQGGACTKQIVFLKNCSYLFWCVLTINSFSICLPSPFWTM